MSSGVSMPDKDKRQRIITFSGCWTCKARKVKCDENPRGCASCARVGEICGGYDIKLQWISQNGSSSHEPKFLGIGRRRIDTGWAEAHQFDEDEVETLLLKVEEDANQGVSSNHGPFSILSFTTDDSDNRVLVPRDEVDEVILEGESLAGLETSDLSLLKRDIPSSTETLQTSPLSENLNVEVTGDGTSSSSHCSPSDFIVSDELPTFEPCQQTQHGMELDSSDALTLIPKISPYNHLQTSASNNFRIDSLFHHYINNVSTILQPVSHPDNPYRSLYAPAAVEGLFRFGSQPYHATSSAELCIFHSLVATSAFHLHGCRDSDSEYYKLGVLHRQFALQSIQLVLARDLSKIPHRTIMVALMSMITIGVMEGNIIDFQVHLTGIQHLKHPRSKWQLISSQTHRLNSMSAFLSVLSRTTSLSTSPSPWLDQGTCIVTKEPSYCYEFTYGVTPDIATFIQKTTELSEHLEFYRHSDQPIPDGVLEACEHLGDRLLSWSLDADNTSFAPDDPEMLDIFNHHAYAWHGGALIYYLTRIQGSKPADLVDEVDTVALHLSFVEDKKAKLLNIQMAPITWPAFIASCNAVNRQPWETWWLHVQRYGIGSFKRQYKIVREIWSEMDSDASTGWLEILRGRNVQVLAV